MNGHEPEHLKRRKKQSSAEHISHGQSVGFDLDEYNVLIGIDVRAVSPSEAMLAAIKEMGLRGPEAYCFHVEHLQSGKK